MDAVLPERLLHNPLKLREHLASGASTNPTQGALELSTLLTTPALDRLHGKALVECLEAAWDSASEWLNLIERSIILSAPQGGLEESQELRVHSRLEAALLAGYQRAIEELRDSREPWWGLSPRLIALSRSADLLIHAAILRSQLYLDAPPGFWLSLHALIREGERTQLLRESLHTAVKHRTQASLQERYIAVALLNTASPEGMPANEIPPLHACLLDLARHTAIQTALDNKPSSLLRFHLERDEPPVLEHAPEELPALDTRLIDPTPVIRALRALLAQNDLDHLYIKDCAVMLSRATLERCVERLSDRAERKSQRASAAGQACLWSGRPHIIHRLQQRAEHPQAWKECLIAAGPSVPPPAEPAPMQIDQEGQLEPPRETLRLTPLRRAHTAGELWEMVSQRRLMTDKPSDTPSPQPSGSVRSHASLPASPGLVRGWTLLDASLQGLRLRGPATSCQHLKVGEPLLIEFPQATHDSYVIGVLRWQKGNSEPHVDIGIEVLARSTLPLRASGPQSNTTAWFDALIMTQSTLGNAPLIMLPNNNYHAGTPIMTTHAGAMVQLRLGRKMLQTAAIAVFQFREERPVEGNTTAHPMTRM